MNYECKHGLFKLITGRTYLNLVAQMFNSAYVEYDYEFFESEWGEYLWSFLGAPDSERLELIEYLKGERRHMVCSNCKYLAHTRREFPFCLRRKKSIKEDTYCILFRE